MCMCVVFFPETQITEERLAKIGDELEPKKRKIKTEGRSDAIVGMKKYRGNQK